MIRKLLFLFVALATTLLYSCKDQPSQSLQKPRIVCTIGMLSNIVEELVGDHYDVINLIGEGVDPHVYKHTAGDVKKLQSADLIFYNGLHLEGKMTDILSKMQSKGSPVFAATEHVVKTSDLLSDDQGAQDPHLWMDVSQWRKVTEYIFTTLQANDQTNALAYETNYNAFDQQLEQLDFYCQQTLQTIPPNKRYLVTAHDAFGYMELAYNLQVRGIQGISTASEAGLKDLEELITFLKQKEIPAVFIESSVNDKNIKALIEGAKAQGHHVKIGGELFSDAMGPKGSYEGTYIGMIDHNVTTITRALGGQAPASGCFGKLTTH